MRRFAVLTSVLLALAFSAFGQTEDPVGFCPPTDVATENTACFNGIGSGNETIGVGNLSIVMDKNGNAGPSTDPWYLLVALPDYTGSAPTISSIDLSDGTSAGFTLVSTTTHSNFVNTTPPTDLYSFVGLTGGSNSISSANMFDANEKAAFGGTLPSSFDVFVYQFTPGFLGHFTPYTITFGSTLPNGTVLAATDNSNGSAFSTPWTTAGLVDGPGCTGLTCGGSGQSTVPEPFSIVLLGTISLITVTAYKKKAGIR